MYCVAYELSRVNESGCFSFDGGFPFTVLAAASVIPVEVIVPWVIHFGPVKLHALTLDAMQVKPVIGGGRSVQIKGWANVCSTLSEVPTFCGPAASFGEVEVDSAAAGLSAWVAAGQRLSGWDMSAVPTEQRTSRASLKFGAGSVWDLNPLMALHCHLAAHSPLTSKCSVAMIEQRFDWRTCICSYFSWAVPNHDALQALLALGPLVELGAGTGYWAWLLTRMGADIIAYDVAESHEGQGYRFRHQLVRDGGVEALKSSGKRALLLCWPDIVGDDADTDSDRGHFASIVAFAACTNHVTRITTTFFHHSHVSFSAESLDAFSGDVLAYIGELGPHVVKAKRGVKNTFPPGGSSASAAFQTSLALNFECIQTVFLPNWPPYNSHLSIWKRRHASSRQSSPPVQPSVKRQRNAKF